MSESLPFEPLGSPPGPQAPPEPPPEPPAPEPPRPREPFWGYADVFVFIGLLLVSAVASLGVANIFEAIFHVSTQAKVAEALVVQSLIYILAFAGLALLFRAHYGRPFWRSLGFVRFKLSPALIVASGMLTAFAVAYIGALIRTPTTSNRITEMLENPKSLLLVAIFGLTLAPLAEELIFRGFLQPLLVRSLGPAPGIIAAAIPFGLLHFTEYGNSWKHVLLIGLAGAAFGWMRHRTGSTGASALMHASYNALEFIAYFAQQKELHHT